MLNCLRLTLVTRVPQWPVISADKNLGDFCLDTKCKEISHQPEKVGRNKRKMCSLDFRWRGWVDSGHPCMWRCRNARHSSLSDCGRLSSSCIVGFLLNTFLTEKKTVFYNKTCWFSLHAPSNIFYCETLWRISKDLPTVKTCLLHWSQNQEYLPFEFLLRKYVSSVSLGRETTNQTENENDQRNQKYPREMTAANMDLAVSDGGQRCVRSGSRARDEWNWLLRQ